MRTVLVTGGAGFLGSHLVDHLLDGGASVRVLDNLSTGSLRNLQAAAERHSRPGGSFGPSTNGSRLEVIIGDIRDREQLRKALRNVKYIFHLAALPPSAGPLTGPGELHSVNVEGTLNVLHAALTEGVWRVVFASCASVYGTPGSIPVSEDAPLRPATLYAASKVAAETYCRAFHARHQLDTVILRYFTIYGPRQRNTPEAVVISTVIEALRRRRPLLDRDEHSGQDLTYVDDAVAATLAASRAPRAAGRVINVGSGQMATLGDVLDILTNLLKIPAVSGFPRSSDARPRHLCAQTDLAAELLSFTPNISLNVGLARVIRVLAETEGVEDSALTPVGRDD
jgi:nucleoside-diphosphate-sugar epimerase